MATLFHEQPLPIRSKMLYLKVELKAEARDRIPQYTHTHALMYTQTYMSTMEEEDLHVGLLLFEIMSPV